eukprot:snap_masked-scaffold181_size278858-processed-gene-0.12 protein:Tk08506 transcript:snap_masked-scaffold181_size278858-processed-gene-0.12-mRNA-1 annotation:"von willebrand factor type egf and pentraxin domain-containing protein 1-like"
MRLAQTGIWGLLLALLFQIEFVLSACSEGNIPPGKPTFLQYDTFDISSGALKLRCSNGRVLTLDASTTGYSADGHLDLTCISDIWVSPAQWPAEDKCLAGSTCAMADLTTGIPAHLMITSPDSGTTANVDSGSKVTYGCSDEAKVIAEPKAPFDRECYNGAFLESNSGPDLPLTSDCVDPAPCALSQINGMIIPAHMKTMSDLSTTVEHGATVDYSCTLGKQLDPAIDPEKSNKVVLTCDSGTLVAPDPWPTAANCQAFCDTITFPTAGFDLPETPHTAWEGSIWTISCSDTTHYLDNDWASNSIKVTCQSDGTFDAPSTWPTCAPRPKCGTPPQPVAGTKLALVDPTLTETQVTQSANYQCMTQGQVTNSGALIKVPCLQANPAATQAFKLPAAWNGKDMVCRAPAVCGTAPTPSKYSGLKAEEAPIGGYPEFSQAKYVCADASHLMYRGPTVMAEQFFEVTCELGAEFNINIDWPQCDVANPPQCDKPLTIAAGVPIELVEPMPAGGVGPGASVFYRCSNAAMTTALGYNIKVDCIKDWSDGSVAFKKPGGWDILKCRPAQYPNFEDTPCICPGDPGVTVAQTKAILDEVCRPGIGIFDESKMVPLKTRCGVTSLNSITPANKCECPENVAKGADFALWTIGEITTYKWHANYSNPGTGLFQDLHQELEEELDNMMLEKSAMHDFTPYVRSSVFAFFPGKPLGCSKDVIPEPTAESGLVVVDEKNTLFGEDIEFKCRNPDYVTNDGFRYKLKCMSNGRYQNRIWLDCRPRKMCIKPPPRPREQSLLKFSDSQNIAEFDDAVYECKYPGHVVLNSPDGKFRTPCKRTSNFEQSVRIDWPTCMEKPSELCEPVPDAPASYVRRNQASLFVPVGQKLTFSCEDASMLIGDAATVSYRCAKRADDSYGFEGLDLANLPACREPSFCEPSILPEPDSNSGLALPAQSQVVKEGGFVEYRCGGGSHWTLLPGDVNSAFTGSQGAIVGGKLRLFCGAAHDFGTVTRWPKCRDTSIAQCGPVPDYSAFGLSTSVTGSVAIGAKVALKCATPGEVTDNFAKTTTECGYDGTYHVPQELTNCRPALECPAAPDAPAETKLIKTGSSSLKEFQIQDYSCEVGFTLDGVETNSLSMPGRYSLACKLNAGEFQPPSAWPQCLPIQTQCDSVPYIAGFKSTRSGPVMVGESVYYVCENIGEITDSGPYVELKCKASGAIPEPDQLPICRKALTCQASPVPDFDTTRLLESPTTNVREFGFATYKCVDGSALPAYQSDSEGNFKLQCGLYGNYPDPPQFPVCQITSCMTVETRNGYSTGDVPPVLIGNKARYVCANPSQIPGNSAGPIEVECLADGTMDYPNPFPECRSKVDCQTPYPVPDQATTHLLATSSSLLKEFQYAIYRCKSGATLAGVSNAGIFGGTFQTQCQIGGTWDTTAIDWPTCIVEFCPNSVIPSVPGFTRVGSGDVAINTDVEYKCSANGYIIDGGSYHTLPCQADGTVDDSATAPTCRAAATCPAPPTPDVGTHIEELTGTINEFSFAEYRCKTGATFEGVTNPDIENNKFKVRCQNGANWPATISWPTCIVEACTEYPTVLGLKPKTTGSIQVGDFGQYTCETEGEVFDTGTEITVECLASGQFDIPDPIPSCRARGICRAPPVPSPASFLAPSTSADVAEFSFAEYACQDHTFVLETDPDVVDGKFRLPCKQGGIFDAAPNWTPCRQYRCDVSTLTIPSGFKTANPDQYVYTDGTLNLVCETEGHISSEGPVIALTCQGDGTFSALPTNPTCAPPAICPSPTAAPPPENSFKPYDASVEVKVYGKAVFECQENLYIKLGPEEYTQTHELLCQGDQSYETPTWPECRVKSCAIEPPAGLQVDNPNPQRGAQALFSCVTANEVTDLGKTIATTCNDDGTYDIPDVQCRSPQMCTATLPSPPPTTNLESLGSSVTKEYDIALYKCKNGFTFKGTPFEDRSDVTPSDFFHLSCAGDSGFPDPIDWPNCKPRCTTALTPPTQAVPLQPKHFVYVDPGSTLEYECSNPRHTVDDLTFGIQCGQDGEFLPPASWPTCRPRLECPFAPEPPQSSNIQINAALPALEYALIKYKCKDGFTFQNTDNLSFPADMTPGEVRMQCGSAGRFLHVDLVHYEDEWPICEPDSNRRRRRWVDYSGLHTDIDYSILMLVEFQFMYAPEWEDEITLLYNSTIEDSNHTKFMVGMVSENVNMVVGDGQVKAGLEFRVPFNPTCEQPTNAQLEPGTCVRLGVPAVCPRAIIEAAWLRSMGYEYAIQEPNWMNAKAQTYHIPVGSEVNFYCQDKAKRPKNDGDNSKDGIISATCKHDQIFSVSMNPSEWDRCRSLCSPEKPEAPKVPEAQLVPYDTIQKQQREHWEDEEISYGCENTSLVINEEIGVKSVTYICQEGGTYSAPIEANLWPKCTPKPIDPVIVIAVRIMTQKYDRNLHYRHALSQGNTTQVDFLQTTEGILSITVPCISVILLLIFSILCCTRANSPICKIFEPQA